MARTFSNTSYLRLDNPPDPGSVGSIVFRFKTSWHVDDADEHYFWKYFHPSGGVFMFYKDFASLIGAGWHTFVNSPFPTYNTLDDHRIYMGIGHSSPGFSGDVSRLIQVGEEVNWCYTWNLTGFLSPHSTHATDKQRFYKNGLVIGADTESFAALSGFTKLEIGANGGGDGSEFARFDYELSNEQRADIQTMGIGCASPGPVHWVKILGNASPEPAEVGDALVLVGAPASATHPTFRPCEAYAPVTKPASNAAVNVAQPLATDLIMAWHFAEGAGDPIERVSNDAPTYTNYGGLEWAADGSYHTDATGKLQYANETVSGLGQMTIAFLMTIDEYSFGSPFPFPNQPASGLIAKQLYDPYIGGAGNESAFWIGYHHADEADTLSGGRDEFWCNVGEMDSWYVFRAAGLPWSSRFQQVFFVYDKDAPDQSRWVMRVNGVRLLPCDIYGTDVSGVIPTTSAPFIIGDEDAYPPYTNASHHGNLQYLYVWSGAHDEYWEPLLANPYVLFAPLTGPKAFNGVFQAMIKTANGLPLASVGSWGGLV